MADEEKSGKTENGIYTQGHDMAEAEAMFDELIKWDDETPEPDLTQIEDIVLKLRKRFGKQVAQSVIMRQENRQPAEKMHCTQGGILPGM